MICWRPRGFILRHPSLGVDRLTRFRWRLAGCLLRCRAINMRLCATTTPSNSIAPVASVFVSFHSLAVVVVFRGALSGSLWWSSGSPRHFLNTLSIRSSQGAGGRLLVVIPVKAFLIRGAGGKRHGGELIHPRLPRPVPLPSRLPDSASLCLGAFAPPLLFALLIIGPGHPVGTGVRRRCDLLLQLLELLERKRRMSLYRPA